jgi:hypothetical protein
MFRRGGARSGRDLNCQSAATIGISAAMQAKVSMNFMMSTGSISFYVGHYVHDWVH